MKIVVTDGYPMNPGDMDWGLLAACGELTVYERSAAEEIIPRLADAEIAIINKTSMNAETMSQLPALRYVGLCSSGCDAVDLAAARERGICVTNVPGYSTMGVAQLTMAHILQIANNVSRQGAHVSAGGWTTSKDFSYTLTTQVELDGKVLGLVGTGAIGQAVARMGAAFGMRVIGCSRSGRSVPGIEKKDFTAVCREADIISLHCPMTKESRNLINKDSINMMKDGVWIINTARGGLINSADLAVALASGKVGGAGLDVLDTEPPPADNPLLAAPDCCITPHLAWMTAEARQRLFSTVISNLAAWQKGTPANRVA